MYSLAKTIALSFISQSRISLEHMGNQAFILLSKFVTLAFLKETLEYEVMCVPHWQPGPYFQRTGCPKQAPNETGATAGRGVPWVPDSPKKEN